MTTSANQPQPQTHLVELELPLDVADELAAKAGSVDAAVIQALQEYLKTDYSQRNAVIKHAHAAGKTITNIAHIYAMSEENIEQIIKG